MTHVSKLKTLQKRAIRIVSGSHYLEHTKPLFTKLHVLSMPDIHRFLTSQFMYRIKNLLLPSSCLHLVTVAPLNREHATRNQFYFIRSKCHTNMKQHSIGYIGPAIWNSLPVSIQNANSIGVFNNLLRSFLISSPSTN